MEEMIAVKNGALILLKRKSFRPQRRELLSFCLHAANSPLLVALSEYTSGVKDQGEVEHRGYVVLCQMCSLSLHFLAEG